MASRTFKASFANGEVSPELYGRIDDGKYPSGLARCRNFIATPQGPAENRPGFAYVRAVKDSTKKVKLLPFTYSTTQTMVLEMGAGYFRFHTAGSTLLAGTPDAFVTPATVTMTIASPCVVTWTAHGLANGTPVRLFTTGALPTELTADTVYYVVSAAADTFQLAATVGGTAINTTGSQSGVHTGAVGYVIGDMVSSGGVDYYCIAAHGNQTPPNATYWYPLPASGEYEIPNHYAEADLFDIHHVQSADVLTLVHPNYPPMELRRYGATNWQLVTISFAASISAPSAPSLTSTGHTTDSYVYEYVVTAVDSEGISESAASEAGGASTVISISAITKANPGVITTAAAHGLVVGQRITISGVVGMTEINDSFKVNTVPTATTLTISENNTPVDTSAYTAYTSGGTITPKGVGGNLFETGAIVTITWAAVEGASRYNVYKLQGGLYGYIGQTENTSIIDDNIAPDLSKTPPIYDNVFNAAGDYPSAVSYFEQRRSFAGTTNKPQNIWMTRSGTESDMSYSLPIRDDDRIAFRVAAREANSIRHIVPMSGLILLTSAAEWRVTSVNSDAITPTSISVRPQSYVGASNVQPSIINNTLLYCAARGGHVRELAYNQDAAGFITGDVCLRAPHLFDGYNILDMAYSKAPKPLVWFVSSSGYLMGFTYVPEQQIGAWHWHDTDGTFESVAAVAEGDEDVLYAVIQRSINGSSVRYIERLHTRAFTDQEDAFFVDCGLTYDGVAADVISGLDHLEGETVSVLADGAVHPQCVVTGGSITLDVEASVVQIGLPITADLQTMPVAFALKDGSFGQGHTKNINKVWLRVYRSSGIFTGPAFDKLTEAKQRTTEVYGAPPALRSEELSITITPSWGDGAQVCVRQVDPLPLTVVSMTAEVEMGG